MLEAVIVSRTLNVASCVKELAVLKTAGYKVDFALSLAEQPACGLKQLKAEGKVFHLAIILTVPSGIKTSTVAREVWARWPGIPIFRPDENPPERIRGFQRIGNLVYLVQREDLIPCLAANKQGDTPPAAPS